MPDTSPTGDFSTFPPPGKFSFDPNDWPTWKLRFERFRQLNHLASQSSEFQVSALVYCMGGRADEILTAFQLKDDAKDYTKVLSAFDNHFIGKRNIVYERARFGSRNQSEGESVEDFVTSLHTLVQHCDYGSLKEDLIRDRIVLGVCDKKLSEKLMLSDGLNLSKAVGICKQWEAVKRQQLDLREHETTNTLDSVSKPKQGTSSATSNLSAGSQPRTRKYKSGKCKFCGYEHEFVKSKCPAVGKACTNCNKLNHFAKCCFAAPPVEPNTSTSTSMPGGMHFVKSRPSETTFSIGSIGQLNTMETSEQRARRWTAVIHVDGQPIDFKLDPGAEVTAVPYCQFRKLWRHRRLDPPDRVLIGPDGTKLQVVGTCFSQLKNQSVSYNHLVYAVKGLERPLLGLEACEQLNLVRRVDSLADNISTNVVPRTEFPELFSGLGKMDIAYRIRLRADAQPFAIHSPRRVPIPLMDTIKEKLEAMVDQGVIEKVDEPTDWCAPLVTAPKANGDIRLCVDLTQLNSSVEREYHPMPVVEHTLGQLAGATVFSKLDANSGFYQILLTEDSRNLTTFLTPFGRFRFCRLPFGISSAPEHFQKRMTEILHDLKGVVIHVDDILVFGATIQEHDARLRAVLERLRKAGVTLNPEKCEFGKRCVKFLGHVIDSQGVRPDPDKISAIVEMSAPSDVTGVKRFLGMTNFLGKFIPHLSSVSKPLFDLTKSDRQFIWGPTQQSAFDEIKMILTSSPVLALYDPNKDTLVSSDASSYGLGAVMLQKQANGDYRPVAYASRTLTTAEQHYAQIEKEALGIVFACERFRDFILGKQFTIETDHKPLIPILSSKCVDDLSPRLQRFRIRLMWYSYTVKYIPGKQLLTADALSRDPVGPNGKGELEDEVNAYVCHVISNLPVSDDKLSEIWECQQTDPTLQQVIAYCMRSWPKRAPRADPTLRGYWDSRDSLTVQNGLLLKNSRLVIPKKLRDEILGRIHEGHLGITKCRARANEACWWPGISEDIAEMIRRCPICIQERKERKEPLMPSAFPARPWQKLAMDLFYHCGKWFLLVVDFYSRYPEVIEMRSLTCASVISSLKMIFSRHGIPEEVLSDNGPQFHPIKTSLFQKFATEYGFLHKTSSPRFPQSNGFVENGVKIMKNLLTKNQDWYKALLEYRATPLQNGYSPAELLMGRRLRSTLPMNPKSLLPKEVNQANLNVKEEQRRQRQKDDFDRRHGVREKPEFDEGELVWVKDLRTWGTISKPAGAPRSFIVNTSRGDFRRNSSHLTRGYRQQPPVEEEIHIDLEPLNGPTQDHQAFPSPQSPNPPRSPYQLRARPLTRPRRLIEES